MNAHDHAFLCVNYVRSVVHRDEYKLEDWQAEKWEVEIERHIRDAQREAAEAMREACAREVNKFETTAFGNGDVDLPTVQAMLDSQRQSHIEVIRKLTWPLT